MSFNFRVWLFFQFVSLLQNRKRNSWSSTGPPRACAHLSFLSISLIKHYNLKQHGEKRVYFALTLSGYSLPLKEVKTGTQGRDLETETETEAMEEPWFIEKILPEFDNKFITWKEGIEGTFASCSLYCQARHAPSDRDIWFCPCMCVYGSSVTKDITLLLASYKVTDRGK